MKSRSEEIVSKIIRLYISSRCSYKTEGEFNAWFTSKVHPRQKDNVLKDIWEETVQVDSDPGRETEAAYRKLAERLGIPAETAGKVQRREPGPKESSVPRRFRLGRRALKIAAVLLPLFLLGGAAWYFLTPGRPALPREGLEVIRITAGNSPREVVLPDSSSLWINASSQVTYKRGFRNGRVVALQGEAYFEVRGNPEAPFKVKTENLEVTVLGTTFNVSDYDGTGEAAVELYTGSVRVDVAGATREMEAGKELVYRETNERTDIYELHAVKPGWLAEPLEFIYEPLSEILRAVGQKFDVEIGGLPAGVPDDTLSIYLDGTEGLEETLFRLARLSGKFNFTTEGTRVIIRNN